MAIEPFRQRIGVQSAGSLISGNAPQVSDPGTAIRAAAQSVREALQPGLEKKAIEAGQKAAGEAVIQRDANGNALKIERPKGGGDLFNAAFDKVAETRYVNQVSFDTQNWLNTEINDRRTGKDGKAFDPDQFEAAVQGRLEGVLKSVDPSLRPAVEETLFREALERTRSFRDEWGRNQRAQAIAGARDQLQVLMDGYARFRDEGLDAGQAYEKYGSKLDSLIARMKDMGQIGGAEADALLMRVDNLVDSAESYAFSMAAATKFIPVIGGLDGTDTEILGNWLRGAPDPRKLGGVTMEGTAEERVTPDTLKAALKQLVPGAVQTSGARAENDPLSLKNPSSYHSVKNGGRAIDVAPIKGMTFDQYVQRWRDAGFTVVEALEEVGSKRSPHATGDHWHIALGNTRKTTSTKDNPEVQGLTFEQVDQLDPSVKRSLLTIVTNREQRLRELEAEQRAAAREAERERKEEERHRELVNGMIGANSAGYGGGWNSQQKGVLDEAFKAQVDLTKLSDPEQRKKALSFIQFNNYLPGPLIQYVENTAVSANWRSAVELYRNVKNATLATGGVVGDMMVRQLTPRTQSLLKAADDLITSGQPDSIVQARMEQLRSGDGFSLGDAISSYNSVVGKGQQNTYSLARNRQIREAYGIPSNVAIPAALSRRIDESYAANLDVANRDPEQALKRAMDQNKGVYMRSGLFFDGVGPSVLPRTFNNQALMRFFSDLADPQGNRALPPMKDADGKPLLHSIGGVNSSIKLSPADNQIGSIGLYNVTIIHPQTKQVLKTLQRVDLGAALSTWASSQPRSTTKPAPANDPIAAARQKKAEEAAALDVLSGRGKPPFLGPKM